MEQEHIKMQLGNDANSKFKNNPEFVVFAQQLLNV